MVVGHVKSCLMLYSDNATDVYLGLAYIISLTCDLSIALTAFQGPLPAFLRSVASTAHGVVVNAGGL